MNHKTNKWLLSLALVLGVSGIFAIIFTKWVLADGNTVHAQLIPIAEDIGWLLIWIGALMGVSAFFYYIEGVRATYTKFVLPMAMVLTSIIIGLIVMEVVLHLKYRDVQVGGSNSPSGLTFYPKYYKYNSWGFRDLERQKVKSNDTFRILVLGDSFTFGSGVKFKEQLYTAILEDKLNSAGISAARFEVINTGLGNLSTEQELRYLLKTGIELDPDIIIVGYVLNDAETPELARKFIQDYQKKTILPARYNRILDQYSFTYYLTRKNLIELSQRAWSSGDTLTGYDAYIDKLYKGSNLVRYKCIVADLARTCHEHGIPLLWVSFPKIHYARQAPYPFSHVTDILRNMAVQNHFKFLDLLPAIQKSEAKQLTVSAWDGHPNEIVHKIAAQTIYSRLISDELVPTSGKMIENTDLIK